MVIYLGLLDQNSRSKKGYHSHYPNDSYTPPHTARTNYSDDCDNKIKR